MPKSEIKKNNKWEKFARDNAEFYVDTNFMNYPEGKRAEKFFQSGRDFTSKTMSRVTDMLPDKQRAIEIGSGVGRLTLHHARVFKEIVAVDIAPTMLSKLEENARQAEIENIRTFLSEEEWHNTSVTYVYSFLVFQHITDNKIIENYIKRIAKCLKQNGIAQLQFDTRPEILIYQIRQRLPDFLLPKNQRKGIQRIRRDAKKLRSLFTKHKLAIKAEINNGTATHTFLLQKTTSTDL